MTRKPPAWNTRPNEDSPRAPFVQPVGMTSLLAVHSHELSIDRARRSFAKRHRVRLGERGYLAERGPLVLYFYALGVHFRVLSLLFALDKVLNRAPQLSVPWTRPASCLVGPLSPCLSYSLRGGAPTLSTNRHWYCPGRSRCFSLSRLSGIGWCDSQCYFAKRARSCAKAG